MDKNRQIDGLVESTSGTGTEAQELTQDANALHAAGSITRRRLLQGGAGAGLAAVLSRGSRGVAAPSVAMAREAVHVPKAPNIVVLMTDQERHHMHWPVGWAEQHLPSLQRLKRHGLSFKRAYTAASQCSPSRALMLSGRFAPVNRVSQT